MERKRSDIAFLDTHILMWLHNSLTLKLSDRARLIIEDCTLKVSPMVLMELHYLFEINRIKSKPQSVLNFLKESIDLTIDDSDFLDIINASHDISWTRDPFDRIIVANAIMQKAYLISADKNILDNYERAVI